MKYVVNRSGNIFGDFDRILSNLFEDNQAAGRKQSYRTPVVDISESSSSYILKMELPGLSEKDIDIKIEKNRLIISSLQNEKDAKDSEEGKTNRFLLKESGSTSFFRTFILPKNADQGKIEAAFSNGILTVNISKKAEEQVRLIKVKAA